MYMSVCMYMPDEHTHRGVCRKLGLIDLILPVCVRVCERAQVCNPCWKEVFVVTK